MSRNRTSQKPMEPPIGPNYGQDNTIDIIRYLKILRSKKSDGTTKFTAEMKMVFLETLLVSGNVSLACERAGISRRCAHNHKDKDEDFSAMWEECVAAGIDRLEQEAFRRGYEGVVKPVFQGGNHVGNIREYSDNLLNTLLKAHIPKYQKVDLSVTDPSGTYKVIDVSKLPTHILEELEKYLGKEDSAQCPSQSAGIY